MDFTERDGSIWLAGSIYCFGDVIIEVQKRFDDQMKGSLFQIRGKTYRYVAWVQGHHALLRYHNTHLNDDNYHHRVFNWRTGEEVLYEALERHQFPTLAEVLDEVHAVYHAFK